MKWLLIFVLVLIAAFLGCAGLLAGADPEGRGGSVIHIFWGAAAVVLVFTVSLIFFWR